MARYLKDKYCLANYCLIGPKTHKQEQNDMFVAWMMNVTQEWAFEEIKRDIAETEHALAAQQDERGASTSEDGGSSPSGRSKGIPIYLIEREDDCSTPCYNPKHNHRDGF